MTISSSGYLALGTGTSTFVEQTGTGYARSAITLSQAGPRRTANTTSASFAATGGNWGTVTQLAFCTTLTSTPLFWWAIDIQQAVASGGSLLIATKSVQLFFADAFYGSGAVTLWQTGTVAGNSSANNLIMVSSPFQSNAGAIVAGNQVVGFGSQIAYITANVLSTSDQVMTMVAPGVSYVVSKVIATNSQGNIAALAGGVYAGPNADSGNVVAGSNTTTYSTALTAANRYEIVQAGAAGNTNVFSTPLRVHFTTAAQAAGTLDFHVYGDPVG